MNTPIKDPDTERALIGSLITAPRTIEEIDEYLTSECFTDQQCRDIYLAIHDIYQRGMVHDPETIATELQCRGSSTDITHIAQLMTLAGIGTQSTYHALHLRELAARRTMWYIGMRLCEAGESLHTDFDQAYDGALLSLQQLLDTPTSSVVTLADANARLVERIQRNRTTNTPFIGTPTGFRDIDRTGGLHATDLIVIAGDTSQGKSSFALTLAANAISAEKKVAYYTLEMTNEQLAARLAAATSGVSSSDILYNRLDDTRHSAVIAAMAADPDATRRLYFDESSTSSLDNILSSIRALHKRYGLDGAIVDYLQILNVNTGRVANPELAMGLAARRLKNLAKDLGIWIIALSQLSRDQSNPEPSLARLRASGQIAEAADTVMLIYRPEYYGRQFPEPFKQTPTKGYAMIDIAKGRNIGLSRFIVGFNPATTQFYQCTAQATPPPHVARPDNPF